MIYLQARIIPEVQFTPLDIILRKVHSKVGQIQNLRASAAYRAGCKSNPMLCQDLAATLMGKLSINIRKFADAKGRLSLAESYPSKGKCDYRYITAEEIMPKSPFSVMKSKIHGASSPAWHRITSPPYSIHLGKKCLIPNHSKVKSSQSEVQIGVSIL